MRKLIALVPILFESKLYGVGTELPTHNTAMVDAWIEAKTAVWKEKTVSTKNNVSTESEPVIEEPAVNSESETESEPVIAKPKTAEPGLEGQAVNSESETGENLVGKVPKTAARSKK